MKSLLVAYALTSIANALYIPGIAPTNYRIGDVLPVYVNSLNPAAGPNDQQLHNVVSYDYYNPAFQFCVPPSGPTPQSESLGSIIFGDRIYNSPIDIRFLQNETCKALCGTTYTPENAAFINEKIQQNYAIEWLIDGLPAASAMIDEYDDSEFETPGFALGYSTYVNDDGSIDDLTPGYFCNFYEILIDYHQLNDAEYRVVGVEVFPRSASAGCDDTEAMRLSESESTDVTFYYSVRWRESDVQWATRWDKYLHVFDPRIHWFSLVESFAIVVFLTSMVAMVLIRTLKKDIQRYNSLDLDSEDVQDDSGWKLIHGDVFRPPKRPMLLAIMLGNGIQLFMMVGTTLAFALLGFLSPSNRGSLATAIILFYALYGFVGGMVSAVMYKHIGGDSGFKSLLFLTPTFIPGIVFASLVFLNFFLIGSGGSGAVPAGTLLALVAIWFLISLPLSVLGGYFGLKWKIRENPVRTNQIPRQVPDQALYMRSLPSILLSGTLPFGAIFVELYFIMSSIWFSRVYYMFGFLFLCYGIMVVTCSTVTILMTYFQLCAENYHWWWRSFFTGGAIAFYVLLNSMVYWITKLSLAGLTANVLYGGYSLLLAFLCFILAGTIGFFASYWFVRKAYASIKVD